MTRWYYEGAGGRRGPGERRIADAIARCRPADVVGELQTPAQLVNAVDRTCLRGNDIVDAVEAELASPEMRGRHPGRRVVFREADHNIYEHAFSVLDPRILSRFWFGSTVKLFGHLVGTDKFGHFTAIGVSYYWRYARPGPPGRPSRRRRRRRCGSAPRASGPRPTCWA